MFSCRNKNKITIFLLKKKSAFTGATHRFSYKMAYQYAKSVDPLLTIKSHFIMQKAEFWDGECGVVAQFLFN